VKPLTRHLPQLDHRQLVEMLAEHLVFSHLLHMVTIMMHVSILEKTASGTTISGVAQLPVTIMMENGEYVHPQLGHLQPVEMLVEHHVLSHLLHVVKYIMHVPIKVMARYMIFSGVPRLPVTIKTRNGGNVHLQGIII